MTQAGNIVPGIDREETLQVIFPDPTELLLMNHTSRLSHLQLAQLPATD